MTFNASIKMHRTLQAIYGSSNWSCNNNINLNQVLHIKHSLYEEKFILEFKYGWICEYICVCERAMSSVVCVLGGGAPIVNLQPPLTGVNPSNMNERWEHYDDQPVQ